MEEMLVKDRLRLLLEHFGDVRDPREAAKVKYPLAEVLFLVTCTSIAGCDDYDEIALWGEHHLAFFRGHSEYFFGTPKEDWLRVVLNRIDPALFEACFTAWATALRPDGADLIALDGKTLRRSGDSGRGTKPIHLVSAWASTQRLVLCQEAVDTKDNECAAIVSILERLSIKGALVTIDAIATNPTIAQAITGAGGDYLLALKRNQPSLHDDVARYFDDPDTTDLKVLEIVDKDHGRIETRRYAVSHEVDWLTGDRRYPDEPRFHALRCLVRTTTQTEWCGKVTEFHCLRSPVAGTHRRSHPLPLGHREHALGPRRHLLRRISPACAEATALKTWRSSDASPSTSSAPDRESAPSRPPERPQAGTQTFSPSLILPPR